MCYLTVGLVAEVGGVVAGGGGPGVELVGQRCGQQHQQVVEQSHAVKGNQSSIISINGET
jgi:hypothetical protein